MIEWLDLDLIMNLFYGSDCLRTTLNKGNVMYILCIRQRRLSAIYWVVYTKCYVPCHIQYVLYIPPNIYYVTVCPEEALPVIHQIASLAPDYYQLLIRPPAIICCVILCYKGDVYYPLSLIFVSKCLRLETHPGQYKR